MVPINKSAIPHLHLRQEHTMASTLVTPADVVRALEVNKQYRILCAGPPRGQNLRRWFDKWERFYAKAKAIGHADIETGFILDFFIRSLEQTLPIWATTAQYDLWSRRLSRKEQTPDFMKFLDSLRRFCAEDLVAGSTRSSSTPNKNQRTHRQRIMFVESRIGILIASTLSNQSVQKGGSRILRLSRRSMRLWRIPKSRPTSTRRGGGRVLDSRP